MHRELMSYKSLARYDMNMLQCAAALSHYASTQPCPMSGTSTHLAYGATRSKPVDRMHLPGTLSAYETSGTGLAYAAKTLSGTDIGVRSCLPTVVRFPYAISSADRAYDSTRMATTRTDSPLPAYAIRLRLCHGGTKCLVLTTCIGVPGCMPARLVVYQRNDSVTQRIWYQPCPAFTTSEPGSGKPSSSYLPSP
eukprot:601528-Rhodomonas_salina.2